MNKRLKTIIYNDYNFKNKREFFVKCLKYPELKNFVNYRKAQFYINSKNIILASFWKWKWLKIREKTKCQISLNAKIGAGVRLLHNGTRVIVSNVEIGKDCAIGINVIIGYCYSKKNNKWAVPKIGDRVYIGHNSTIVGDVKIGNDVLIAPNTYVNKDVPDNSIVVGNNEIIKSEKPSAPYLKLY